MAKAKKSKAKPAAKKSKPAAKKKAPAKKPAAKKPAAKKAAVKKTAKKPTNLVPTVAEETRFWSLLEDAWATQSAETNAEREAIATRKPGTDYEGGLVTDALDAVLEHLKAVFEYEEFSKEELVAMDRVVERKLFDIDRQAIQEVTDGSDDGFLYARGFIVAVGKKFYDAVNANPEMAIVDMECEEMCYLPSHVYSERFGGEFPETGSGISRESVSNRAGWPDL